MHDQTPESLRKLALKHGSKTVSKKAKALSKQSSLAGSRLTSRANSAVNSRNPSAANSRAGSDVASLSDEEERPRSPNSIDALILEEVEPSTEAWQEQLAETIKTIEDRNWKTSNAQTRQNALLQYLRAACAQFVYDDLEFRLHQIVGAFVKIIKADDDPLETSLALKALAVTTVTAPSSDIYEAAQPSVKRAITDSSDIRTKTLAIQTLAVLSFYGETSDEQILENLTFFLEIISSDGEYVDALDEPEPVAAALKAYGFLATLADDLSSESSEALETFVDQLDSSSASVIISSGENIALLYEKAYISVPKDEVADERSPDILVLEDDNEGKEYYQRQYDLYEDQKHLETKLRSLTHSSKSVSKTDRKSLHSSFADILHSVQNPTHGPHFSTALDPETGLERGSRMKLKSPGKGKGNSAAIATIDKWWLLHRHRALKEVLGPGFLVHYEANEAIFEALPIVFVAIGSTSGGKGKKGRSGNGDVMGFEHVNVELYDD